MDTTQALEHFTRVWSDRYLAADLAATLTCEEADSLADVLHTAGHHEAAETWIKAHAAGDDEDDAHRHNEQGE